MKIKCLYVCLLAVATTAIACGGNSGSATAPTPSTPTSITISSISDQLLLGGSETFIANGSGSVVTWGTDAPTVASVDGSGKVTGMGSGMATVFADSKGVRGTKLIRVLPGFQGVWSGSYVVTGCTQTGTFAVINFCSNFGNNRVLPTNMTLTQTRDAVTGSIFLGTLSGSGNGPVSTDGSLPFDGTIRDGDTTIITSWGLQSTVPGRMTGGMNFIWRTTGVSGEIRVTTNIRDLNRTSNITGGAAPMAVSDGTLQGTLRGLIGR